MYSTDYKAILFDYLKFESQRTWLNLYHDPAVSSFRVLSTVLEGEGCKFTYRGASPFFTPSCLTRILSGLSFVRSGLETGCSHNHGIRITLRCTASSYTQLSCYLNSIQAHVQTPPNENGWLEEDSETDDF